MELLYGRRRNNQAARQQTGWYIGEYVHTFQTQCGRQGIEISLAAINLQAFNNKAWAQPVPFTMDGVHFDAGIQHLRQALFYLLLIVADHRYQLPSQTDIERHEDQQGQQRPERQAQADATNRSCDLPDHEYPSIQYDIILFLSIHRFHLESDGFPGDYFQIGKRT